MEEKTDARPRGADGGRVSPPGRADRRGPATTKSCADAFGLIFSWPAARSSS